MITCPKCGLVSPSDASVCDCGANLLSRAPIKSVDKMPRFLRDFRMDDRPSCEKVIRNGGIAALVSGGLTLAFGVAGFFTGPGQSVLLDPYVLIDAALIFILAWFVFRRSRIASTILVLHFLLSKVVLFSEGAPMSVSNVIIAIGFMLYYVSAMWGTYIWHQRYSAVSHA